MIRKGTKQDIASIMEITKACAKVMNAKEIYQWNEHYPNPTAFIKDVERGELYILEINDTVLNDFCDQKFFIGKNT